MDEDTRQHGASMDEPSDRRSSMRARTWLVAARYYEPADYDVPRLPAWTVTRPPGGGIAFAAGDADPFVRAERPTRVRR